MENSELSLSNETMIEFCEKHKFGEPNEMGFVTCSKCCYGFNIHDDNDYDDDNMDLFCPKCHLEYDSIDYEFQICHHCSYENE